MFGPFLGKSEHITIIIGDSSSTDEQTRRERFWNSVEFVTSFVQIVAAIVVLTRAKDEHPETTWIIGYACGCIATLPILYWRYWHYQNFVSEIRINDVVDTLSRIVTYFFVGWFVLFVCVFLIGNSSLDHTSQPFGLCMVFLAFVSMRHVIPNLIWSIIFFCCHGTLCIDELCSLGRY
ncbi:unnamed protein product [Eruca vesicaria subsp. sativa]|uniref:Transmembrane protein n=1 Tax=Eruca vesicaria subsp. sativa TaxID=29727 RepID=A0ABC8J0R0_ERUVS|nr:unnamed protein product [Eruca vesicaria subsp. sativa]